MKNTIPCVADNTVNLPAGPPPVDADVSSACPINPITKSSVELELEPARGFAAVSQTEANLLALTPPQQTAIGLLTSGHTLVDAATAAGVSRMTLHRWLKGDAAFSAAFNAWQKDVLDTARGRLLALTDTAVTTVAKSMARGDARTALKILASVGLLDRAKPGSTDAKEIQRLNNLEQQKAQTALKKAEARAEMESYESL